MIAIVERIIGAETSSCGAASSPSLIVVKEDVFWTREERLQICTRERGCGFGRHQRGSFASMGSKKRAYAEKKAEVPVAAGVPKPQASTRKESKEDEIEAIFANKKRKIASENQPTLAEEDGTGSRFSLEKKKKGKKTPSPAVEQEDKRKVGSKESRGGKAGKSSSAGAEPKKSRKKTADGFTVYGEDELKWNSKDAGGTSLCPFDCECCF